MSRQEWLASRVGEVCWVLITFVVSRSLPQAKTLCPCLSLRLLTLCRDAQHTCPTPVAQHRRRHAHSPLGAHRQAAAQHCRRRVSAHIVANHSCALGPFILFAKEKEREKTKQLALSAGEARIVDSQTLRRWKSGRTVGLARPHVYHSHTSRCRVPRYLGHTGPHT